MRPPPSGHYTRWEPQSEHTGSGRQRTVTGGGRGALEGSRGGLPMLTLTVKSEGTAVGPCQAVGTACAARSRRRPGSRDAEEGECWESGGRAAGGLGPKGMAAAARRGWIPSKLGEGPGQECDLPPE